jgi:NADH dehydrogenase
MKEIVILGGGYAGVTTAVKLGRRKDARITVVNDHSYHHLTTLLHQPAVGRRSFRDLSIYLNELLPRGTVIQRGYVRRILPDERKVLLETRGGPAELRYDLLVLALGWEPEFFNIPGLAEHALTLKNLLMSRQVKERIDGSLMAFDQCPDQHWRKHIVIGGGGLTGIELAGELAESRESLAHNFDLRPEEIAITLVDAAPRLLNGLDPWLSEQAQYYLQQHGVTVRLGLRIAEVRDHAVCFADGTTIEAGTIVWAGGVRGNPVVQASGFAVNRAGRAEVNEYLQIAQHPEIFVAGDCAQALSTEGKPLPPTAQLAVQQGECVAANLKRLLRGEPLQPYRAKMMGIVLSVGRTYAVGLVDNHRLRGKLASVVKDAIAFKYVYTVGGLSVTVRKFFEWLPYLVDLHHM